MTSRLPLSGNAALAAGALIQAALGIEFLLAGPSKVAFRLRQRGARRRFSGRFGEQHPYEPAVALLSSAAGVAIGGLSLMIYVIEGGVIPRVSAAFAFGSPIAIELVIVPLAIGIAWLQFGRFQALTTRLTAGPTNLPNLVGRGKQTSVAGTPAVEADPKHRRTATRSTGGVCDGRSDQRRPDPPARLGSLGCTPNGPD